MNQCRDRGRAFHRVGQPSVQAELGRLAHGADEQQQTADGDRIPIAAEQVQHTMSFGCGAGEDRIELHGTEQHEDAEDAEREAEIAHAIDDEGLDGGGRGRGLLVPEADQQIGSHADAFPAEEHLDQVVRGHQHQHGEGEQRQVGMEARHRRVVMHVPDRVDMHHEGDPVDHDQHDRGQGVEFQAPGNVEVARDDPAQHRNSDRVAGLDHVDEDENRQQGREAEQDGRNQLGGAVTDLAPEQAGDGRAEQRQEDDSGVHQVSPSSD